MQTIVNCASRVSPLGVRHSGAASAASRNAFKVALPARRIIRRCSAVPVSARSGGYSYSSAPDLKDRAVAALPYVLPLIASYPYGKFLFYQYPAIQSMMSPILPLIQLYYSIPFASLVLFLGVYAGIVTNDYWSRFVRYNAMQAVLLDIALIVPRLLEQFMGQPSTEAMMQLHVQFQNTVWIVIAGCVAYSIFMCLTGQVARIPLVSDAVDQQVR